MTQTQYIEKMIASNNGMIQTLQVIDARIAKTVFYQYVKDNDMGQISHCVYVTQDTMCLLHI